ncbi:rop guanine nucleotide exchange factor 12 [Capsicum galapagoense]
MILETNNNSMAGFKKSRLANDSGVTSPHSPKNLPSDMELMKEKFAKLLLGEDMSGGGKGVSSALALSNAITNLSASVFGEMKRLEPMSAERKEKWRKEIGWLLSVTDHIVEFVPCKQKSKDGTNMEVMVTKQRSDLQMNIPALRKLDAMLIDCLDGLNDQHEFSYVSKDDESEEGKNSRKDDKWWIPTPKVPPNGLSDFMRKWLRCQKDSVNQVHKAAMAINSQVLSEMAIPESYIESLPKNGRASLGDSIYKSITEEYFDPDYFFTTMDMSSEHKILDLKDRIEASVVIWRRKMNAKDGKSSWGSTVSFEKRGIFEERAEVVLLILKQHFPGISQSTLDISKIQYNKDVGQAVLESYSRIIESRAFTIMSRIEDVLQADAMAQNPSNGVAKRPLSDKEEAGKLNSADNGAAMTLMDFIGWTPDQESDYTKKDLKEDPTKDIDTKIKCKAPNIVTNKRFSYLENLGMCRSPTARH